MLLALTHLHDGGGNTCLGVLDTDTGEILDCSMYVADNVVYTVSSGYVSKAIMQSFICRPLAFGYLWGKEGYIYWRGYAYRIPFALLDIDIFTDYLYYTTVVGAEVFCLGGSPSLGIRMGIDTFERKCIMEG